MSATDGQPARPVLWRKPPHGRVLVFAPHPDDEVAGPGGILALHQQNGDAVRVVVTTDGTNGDPDGLLGDPDGLLGDPDGLLGDPDGLLGDPDGLLGDPDGLLGDPDGLPKSTSSYAEMRRRESRAGLAELGIDDVTFWGFPDGFELSETDIELGVRRAAEAIRDHRPDVVYLPWEREGHPDHHALFVVVTRALDRVAATHAPLALGYEVWNAMIPDVIVDTTTTHEQKRRAMLAHASQIAYVRYEHAMSGLSAYRSLVHLRGRGYGEALCLVRGTLPAELADRDA